MKSLIVGAAVAFTACGGLAQGQFPFGNKKVSLSPQQNKARIEWTRPAVLQSDDVLVPAGWEDLSEATSPYDVEPANAQRFYRLRKPRRRRCGTVGREPREGFWSAAGLCRFSSASSSRTPQKAPGAWRTPKREATPGAPRDEAGRAGWPDRTPSPAS